MIVFAICSALVFIVLLTFETIRRFARGSALAGTQATSSSTLRPLQRSLNNYVFAFQGTVDGTDAERTADKQVPRAELRETASFRKPWVSSRSFIRTRFQRFKPRGFLRARSSLSAPKCSSKPLSVSTAQQQAQSLHDDHFSCALDLLPLAVIVTDPDGEIVFANVAASELFGYPVDELLGANAEMLGAEIKPERYLTEPPISSPGMHAGGGTGLREVVAVRKDGNEFPVEISVNHISTPKEAYALSIFMDRTERIELARHRQQLAHLTRVSTLGELAGSLAHELNQPLTAILSNAQAAQRFITMEPVNLLEVREILHDLVQDTHRASEVIRKIRALVKKGEIEAAPLSVAGVIRDVALLVHSDAIVRGVRVVVIAAAELPPIQGDKVQLQQVILNLLLNAFDAMEKCALPERVVSIRSAVDLEGDIRVAVQDCGTGISRDTVSKLFMPFFTSKRDGLGLGLSISRSIVEMHGGRMWAENNKDQGATFYFTLPAGRPPASVSPEAKS